jgi:DNA-directed RNA polymerase beta' subunit
MPTGFTQTSSDLESIVGIQFSIFSPDEIERRSVVEITSQATYEGNEPKIGGLFDPRMGVLDNGKVCRSCGQTNHGCPGHFGHYRLTRPVYYIQFLPMIMNVLKCVCIRCSKLLIDKDLHKGVLGRRGEARWREVLTTCSNISRCGQQTEDGCGAPQPNKYTREGIARIRAHYTEMKREQDLEVEYVHRLFRRITDDDVDFMGLSRYWCRPDWMICTILAVPPPQVRPSVVQDNNQRSEDDLTHKLFEIIKNDKTLQLKIENNASRSVIDEWANVVQYHVATLVNNQIPGVAPSAQRSGRPLKSIQERLGSKEGRIRFNIQGKRVEFSARSVITPDPNISIEELGVPVEIASNLTFPERVTVHNRNKLYKLVQNGADNYPGAKTIVRGDGRMISLKHVNAKDIVLYNGDIVNRHLLDGDVVLFNRQPTLHKMSMMAHKVKVMPYKTFRLNVLVVKPYNADFDGDEMNLHCPQSEEAAVELEDIAAIPHNIVTPRHAKPLIGVFQDTLVGSYRLTRPNTEFTRREFMNLMMTNKRFDGTMPVPVARNGTRFTGQQLLSQLLPPLNIEMGNKSFDNEKEDKSSDNFVKIIQGEIQQGIVDTDIYMKPGKGIIHVTYNDYGPKETVDLLDSLQTTIENYLVLHGFSVGISDLVADENTKQKIQEVIQDRKKQVEQVILQVHTDLFDNNTGKTNQQEFEDQVFGILNQATSDSGKAAQASLSSENRLVAMVKSGSKGDSINIAQMIACLGQTAVEGKRIAYGFTDRTLPHYKKYDDSAEARGFIESSFIRGLTPQEFFFHAMSGREGLIDTAVKTAETGYIQRQLIKAMEDLVVQHDGTVRDSRMNIVQYYYGEDSVMATKLESQSLPLGKLSHEEIRREFGMEGVDWIPVLGDGAVRTVDQTIINSYVDQVIDDQRMMIEGVFQSNSLDSGTVNAPVNLARLILNIKIRFGLSPTTTTTLTPEYVLQSIDTVVQQTRSNHHRIWKALLHFHLAPHKLIIKERFTKDAFDMLCELIIVNHMKSWVQPGEQVGIVAAQSIGEPATQMSAIGSTIVCITDGKTERFRGPIKDFIDPIVEKEIGNTSQPTSSVIPLDKDYYIVSVNDTEKTAWKRISEISRHPANGGLVEVTTKSGRTTTATLSHSFLKRSASGAPVPVLGSDLRIGMRIPIARAIEQVPGALDEIACGSTVFKLTKQFGWLCGAYLANGSIRGNTVHISKIHPDIDVALTAIAAEYGWDYMLDGSIHSIDLKDMIRSTFNTGDKVVGNFVFHSNVDFIAGVISGYFDGAGSVNTDRQQIHVSSCSKGIIRDINSLLSYCGIFGIMREEASVRSPDDIVYTLNILKKFASDYKRNIGFNITSNIVDLDALIKCTDIACDIYDRIPELGSVIAKTCMLLRIPGQPCVYDCLPKKESIGRLELQQYISDFDNMLVTHKGAKQNIIENIAILKSALNADIVWDEIKCLTYMDDPKEYVYDFTVPGNDSFLVDDGILVHNTLNTFHQAGVASKSSVTRGVPRLRELLKITKNPKATSLTIYLKPEFRQSKEKAREVVQDLELTLLRSITLKVAIYWDPSDEASTIDEDRKLLEFYRMFEESIAEESKFKTLSKWILRLELNREEMFNKNISMSDVAFVIKSQYLDSQIVYNDYNSDKLIMRIRLPMDRDSSTATQLDDYTVLKKFQNKLLNNTVIRGVPGIKASTFRKDTQKVQMKDGKYEQLDQYILDTDGSNFIKVANHPAVDPTRLYTTNVHDIMDILGLEAVRAIILSELNALFDAVGVNYRHLGILCDMMTRTGRLMSIDRYGINKNDIGPIAKMSFEETEKITLKAALFGEVDPVTGVSASVMTGQPFRGGTAFSQILLDESALQQLTSELADDDEEDAKEEDGDITGLLRDDMQIEDPCSTAQFQMNISMPPTVDGLVEPDIELAVIDEEEFE